MRIRLTALLLLLGSRAAAVEKWADPSLRTTQGLILWLDASRQPEAWQAHGKPSPPGNSFLDVAYDASGQGLHLTQRLRESQPRFFQAAKVAVIRFDGKDDYLGLTRQNRRLERFTLFIHGSVHSNAGFFRALFAVNETGKNDYTTGFTVDLTGESSAALDRVNVEGKGFGGAVNLLNRSYPFNTFHTLAVTCEPGKEGVRLFLDGVAAGKRARSSDSLRMDDISVGARYYSNTAEPPCMTGFLDGDIAEVLLFDRILSADESKAVQEYLKRKYSGIEGALGSVAVGVPLRTVVNPPPVQVLLPGFVVKEIPVDLPNINNIRYRADGKLVALGYNGNVYLLSDSMGKGLEDKVEVIYENKGSIRAPIGMALTPPRYRHGNGVFIACKGKVVLLIDSKQTGRFDREIVVASGWKELAHGVDALGVAIDKDENVYFGLGCADYTNPYLLDREGKSHYDIKSERGTILKVSPDFKKREIIATGIRFPVGLAFNRDNRLFATDQEGATWLPNGNPLDKLLEIRPRPRGDQPRHYGFPPRHPKHLPDVADEPSVFDYGPQHQSTCGLVFNEPVNGGPVFGPEAWRGDALIAGYSRGKLYRSQVLPNFASYGGGGQVASTQLLACINMLTVDSCVSPRGELVLAVHSGAPDWGSGPAGKGRLYKIIPEKKPPTRPVLIWPAGAGEVRIAFDQPLDPEQTQGVTRVAVLEYGESVRAGDRFEVLRPGYATVQQQLVAPRRRLSILSAAVTPDRRTLLLTTTRQPIRAHHALTLPGWGRPDKPARGELPQHSAIDLEYDLSGVEATWKLREGSTLRIWLPHLDLEVARKLTAGSADHDQFWQSLRKPGRLTLRTLFDMRNLSRPSVQPGSKLDYTPGPEKVGVFFSSWTPFQYTVGDFEGELRNSFHGMVVGDGSWIGETTVSGFLPIKVIFDRGPESLQVHAESKVAEVPGTHPRVGSSKEHYSIPLHRFVLPWVEQGKSETLSELKIPELEGGSWVRGRQVYFSEEAACFKCHKLNGQGGSIGPDLSNLVHRDYASVLKDIVEPSAAINPDHLAYMIELKSGRVLSGVLRSEGPDRLMLGDNTGKETPLKREDIETMTPSPVSLMPEGIDKVLGREKMRDLLTFLLKPPLEPAPLERPGAPPPRTRAEVEKVLKTAEKPAKPSKKLRILLAAAPKDHGPGEHDYPLWQRRWYNLLSLAENVSIELVTGFPAAKQIAAADVIVFYSNNPGWNAEKGEQLDAFLKRGGGLVYLHYAVDGHKDSDALAKRIGLAWKGGLSRFRHGPLELSFPAPKHPITRGFDKLNFIDESYWNLVGDPGKVHLLASGIEEGKPQPLLWTHAVEKGRVFVSILGHYNWTFDDPLFRVLILRAIAWTAGEPADRLIELATVGARIGE
jgi:putative heme-binding domain-containing protein